MVRIALRRVVDTFASGMRDSFFIVLPPWLRRRSKRRRLALLVAQIHASKMLRRGLHPYAGDRRRFPRTAADAIAVAQIRFESAGNDRISDAGLIFRASRFIAKYFTQRLQTIVQRILDRSTGKRVRADAISVREPGVDIDFDVVRWNERSERLGVERLKRCAAVPISRKCSPG